MAKSKNEVAVKENNTAMAIMDESMFDEALQFGNEVSADDVAIPRIAIAQALSKVLEKGHSDYNSEVSSGDFYDKSTGNVWDGEAGIKVLPIHYRRTYLEWETRKKGGNFVGDRGLDMNLVNACTRDDDGKLITPDGNILSQVAEYAVFVLDGEGGFFPAMISMSGTQFKKSKNWMAKITNLLIDSPKGKMNPPMFFRSYNLTSQPEKNDQGSWFGFSIEGAETVQELTNGGDIWKAAVEFRKQMDAGEVKVASYESETPVEDDEDSPM